MWLAPGAVKIGLIADTHGLLRPEAVDALRGCDAIIHAGDIGDPAVLAGLEELAPVTAIRGNIDKDPWAAALPDTEILRLSDAAIFVIHNIADLDLDPRAAGFSAVIAGHSHHPGCRAVDGVLFVNPGSAGPRRFRLPVSVGRLTVTADAIAAEWIGLAGEQVPAGCAITL